ncbi:hypothetical protein FRC01_003257 [Tulasnella sp. 417]|nr:hypothetical protein FRC01_003257 [Tulasnella sp. 417]
MPVNKGDVLIIPAPNGKYKTDEHKTTIRWQQMFRQREGDYYLLVAKNKSQGYCQVPFYIQAEWYNEQGFNSAYGMSKLGNDSYELTIDNRHQYAGEPAARFVVWHDQDREPYADRFLQSSLLKQGTDMVKEVYGLLGLSWTPAAKLYEAGGELSQSFIGTSLKTF